MAVSLAQSRRWTSRVGMAIGFVFLFAIADTFVSGHLESKTTVRVMAGEGQAINGELALPAQSAREVRYTADSAEIQLEIIEARGRLWRGKVMVPAATSAGTYRLRVFNAADREPDKTQPMKVLVFDSLQNLRESHLSLTRRWLGIAPWWIVICALPLLILMLYLSFRCNSLLESRLASQGMLPIVKMSRTKEHWEITAFVSGDRAAIGPGDRLMLVNSGQEPVGEMRIVEMDARTGRLLGLSELSGSVTPRCWVKLPPAAFPDH